MVDLICSAIFFLAIVNVVAFLVLMLLASRRAPAPSLEFCDCGPEESQCCKLPVTECLGGPRDGLVLRWSAIEPPKRLSLPVPHAGGEMAEYSLRGGVYVFSKCFTLEPVEE